MNISDRFSSALGRRDEEPNKRLAREISIAHDKTAIRELVKILCSQPAPDTLADAIKVLEMVGEQQPALAHPAFPALIPLIRHPENKIVWRSMAALSTIASYHTEECFQHLGLILKVMDRGSVITRDHGFRILLMLYQDRFRDALLPLLKEQLLSSPDNQLGQYAEKWMAVIARGDLPDLRHVLEIRLQDLVNPSHQKRIARVLMKLNKMK